MLTILKAALNHAFQEGKTNSDEAWRRAKPYREADAAKIRYLTAAECRRLLEACEGAFRDRVRGALATGCRYGEFGRIRVSDFDAQARTVMIAKSKQAKPRPIALSDEGAAFFAALTAGRPRTALVFSRADGEPWGASHQQRPLIEASARARLEPPCAFHILRHTYASALATKGVPMRVIADQLGHADTRVTEKHYAHLTPSYGAEAVRHALPALGLDAPPAASGFLSTFDAAS
ncbi:tyrosine-type recombinase/integrase [Methylobacterium sp. J-070]|uniref:tyrosine-type recombinase/integrase n=1 Tax=Methylobacterium sp. J-070 TaxID=2836650 RepID=UPI001FBB4896|nr:site-specific integrase [Methylobacterium sp. J-070]MCJ2051775.1 site-specific integrase [Methylobacterium sp. J-070]